MKIKTILRLMRFWPPFIASGISVKSHDLDKGLIISQLKTRRWNCNPLGTHYGGSLFSMCDPFYMLILMHKLGKKYFIWDLETKIFFRKSTPHKVTARFHVSDQVIESIKTNTKTGHKTSICFETQILDAKGETIAEIHKKLYIRLQTKYRILNPT